MTTAPSAPALRRRPSPVAVGAGVLVVAGVLLRWVTTSDLWLDEALTVNISRLPLADIGGALRRDGAPPLYYWALHLWMQAFGTGDAAVRSLSGLISTATLPVVWLLGSRLGGGLGGRRVAWAATLVLATNPFAIHYATEARMYALVALEVAVGLLAVLRAIERPTIGRLVPVGLVSAALLYTHYWALFLLAATGVVLAVRAWRGGGTSWAERCRSIDAQVLAALASGAVLWLPWVPTFLEQSAHTGTPWATPAGPAALVTVPVEFSGGSSQGAIALCLFLAALVLLGVLGRPVDGRRIELDLAGRAEARPLFAVFLLAPSLAILSGLVSNTAFVARYTSVVLPLFVLLAGLGLAVVLDTRRATIAMAAVGLLGLGLGGQLALRNRTQAGELAGYMATTAQSGDLVVFCPDQLGPSTLRLLGPNVKGMGYPRATDPRLIDWYDYDAVNEAASPAAFAALVAQKAGPDHDVWLVSSHGYITAPTACTELETRLLALRPLGRQVVMAKPGKYFEDAALIRYPS